MRAHGILGNELMLLTACLPLTDPYRQLNLHFILFFGNFLVRNIIRDL